MEADVLVIGGGPAGLAAAIAAAQAGCSVALAEPRAGALDKCCGEGLLPVAVDALSRLGIPLARLRQHGSLLTGISFHGKHARAGALFRSPAMGIRRTALHLLLQERARQLRIRFVPSGARLSADGQDHRAWLLGPSQTGEQICARWIVGADGAMSATRATAGLGASRTLSRRFAIRQHFRLSQDRFAPSSVEVHWAPGAQAYVTFVGGGCVGVAVVSAARFGSMEAALAPFPAVRALLGGARACSAPQGAVTFHRTLRAVHRGRVALVGDASGSVDAVTGDGLSLAFAQALALAGALRAGDLREYGRAHKRLMRVPKLMSRALLAVGSHPIVTRVALGSLAHLPGVFPALLNLHTRGLSNPVAPGEVLPWLPVPTSAKSEM